MTKKHETVEIIARGVHVADGRILLCHTKGAWNTYLPGGHVEFGESAGDALLREIKEEMGCSARLIRFLGVVENRFRQKGEWHCEVNLIFQVQIKGVEPDNPPISKEDYIEFLWCAWKSLPKSGLEPFPLRTCLRKWLALSPGVGWGSTFSGRALMAVEKGTRRR